jgi:hypothetical protein
VVVGVWAMPGMCATINIIGCGPSLVEPDECVDLHDELVLTKFFCSFSLCFGNLQYDCRRNHEEISGGGPQGPYH